MNVRTPPPSLLFPRELAVAVDAAQEAGRIILEVYATPFAVESKGRDGPVTDADTRANASLVDRLRREFPDDGIVAEESADLSESRKRRCWWVDPLDGTREFVERNGQFAVHVGLAIDGEARLGVVYAPVDLRLHTGVVGEGGFVCDTGTCRPTAVTTTDRPDTATLAVSRSHRSERNERLKAMLGVAHVLEAGSVGRKCGMLADGRADAYVHFGDRSARWDSCAPEAVLRAAGGDLTDLHGTRYRYDDGELHNTRGLFGCNAALRPALVRGVLDLEAFVRARAGRK